MIQIPKALRRFIVAALVVLGIGLTAYSTCFYSLDPTAVGLSRNAFTGQIVLQNRTGYHVKPPWVFVSIIDTRPTRVCVTSAAHAAFNCKLVRFVPSEWHSFIRVEGFGLYWWANRFSFNLGYREEYRGMKDILRGYAFSAQHYPFIQVVEQYDSSQQ